MAVDLSSLLSLRLEIENVLVLSCMFVVVGVICHLLKLERCHYGQQMNNVPGRPHRHDMRIPKLNH